MERGNQFSSFKILLYEVNDRTEDPRINVLIIFVIFRRVMLSGNKVHLKKGEKGRKKKKNRNAGKKVIVCP